MKVHQILRKNLHFLNFMDMFRKTFSIFLTKTRLFEYRKPSNNAPGILTETRGF